MKFQEILEERKEAEEADPHTNPASVHHERSPGLLSEMNVIVTNCTTHAALQGALRDRAGD